ncbi:MAG TPA: hypothetical protein VIQ30_25195 [Pseudonocardia sp.]
MTALRRSAWTLAIGTFCIVVGVAFAVIFLVGLAVTVQMIGWWLG